MLESITLRNAAIAALMWKYINTWPDKPVSTILLDTLQKNAVSMQIQQLPSNEKVREFVDGTFVGRWNFALTVRIPGNDVKERLDAGAVLLAAYEWMIENPPSDIGENREVQAIEMTNTPAKAAEYDDKTEDYQAVYYIEYFQGGKP